MDLHFGSAALTAQRSVPQRRLPALPYRRSLNGDRLRPAVPGAASPATPSPSPSPSERAVLVASSSEGLSAGGRPGFAPASPTGFDPLDAWLPEGGWPHAAFTDLLTHGNDACVLCLLAPALAATLQAGRLVMLFDPPSTLSAWLLGRLGLDERQLLTIDGRVALSPAAGSLWVLEQSLASGSVGAVVAWLPPQALPTARRQGLQQAVRRHDGPAFLIREAAAAHEPREPSLDDGGGLRLSVQAAGRDLLALRRIPQAAGDEPCGRLLIGVVPPAAVAAGDGTAPAANPPDGPSTARVDRRDDAPAARGWPSQPLRSAVNEAAGVVSALPAGALLLPAGDVAPSAGPSVSEAASAAGDTDRIFDPALLQQPLRAAVFVDLGG